MFRLIFRFYCIISVKHKYLDENPVFRLPKTTIGDDSTEIWSAILHHVSTDGPFARVSKSLLNGLVAKSVTLFPPGFPKIGVVPMKEHLSPEGLYEQFLRRICARSIPIPLASRWGTVEKTRALLLLLMRTLLMKFELTKATNMAYWAVGSIRIDELKEADYRRKSSARLQRVSGYTSITEFDKTYQYASSGLYANGI